MKVITKTLKGFANTTNLIFSENTQSTIFDKNLKQFVNDNLQGYKKLSSFSTLKGKKASHKVVIYGYYWRGNWADKTKEIHSIYYK